MDDVTLIERDGFRVRPWRLDDKPALLRHADDERVSRGLSDRFPWPYTDGDADEFLQGRVVGTADSLAIEVDGAAVGGIGMRRGVDVHRLSAEIGYWLGCAYWGRGLMSRIVPVWCAHLFSAHPFLRLEAKVYSNNPTSAHLLEKCGFSCEGIKRNAAIKRGEIPSTYRYTQYCVLRPRCREPSPESSK